MRRYFDMLVYGGEKRVVEGAAPPPIGRRLFHVVAGSSIPLAGIFFVKLLRKHTLSVFALCAWCRRIMVCSA
jgi:hypothetical protein